VHALQLTSIYFCRNTDVFSSNGVSSLQLPDLNAILLLTYRGVENLTCSVGPRLLFVCSVLALSINKRIWLPLDSESYLYAFRTFDTLSELRDGRD
jgi:hypothetical protein